MITFDWTDERVTRLKELWAEGASGSVIARLFGTSRNSVIGKAHRLKLPAKSRQSSMGPKRIRSRKPRRKPLTPAPTPAEDIVVPISLNVSLMALNDSMCKWPIGDPCAEGFHFCGHKNFNGLPYCEYHSRVAYQPAGRRAAA